jgi:hypothetical protein
MSDVPIYPAQRTLSAVNDLVILSAPNSNLGVTALLAVSGGSILQRIWTISR